MALAPTSAPRRPRVALYGHDTLGLGHLRRNLALAQMVSPEPPAGLGADVLLLTGAREVGLFPRSPGVEALVLPGVRKDVTGRYRPRTLRDPLSSVLRLRRSTLTSSLLTFAPDLLVVDKSPWGFEAELTDALFALHDRGCALVLGLRDVLDSPSVTAQEWAREGGDAAALQLYREIWVYGDRRVHDLGRACAMHDSVEAKTVHVGYLAQDQAGEENNHRPLGDTPYVLVTAGGGQDGVALLRAAVQLPPMGRTQVVILTGPQLSDGELEALQAVAQARPHIHLYRFSPHSAEWIAGASAVVSMAGANTVTEILATSVPALLVPRVHPRREQEVRARALADAGAVDLLVPRDLHPDRVAAWLEAHLGDTVPRQHIRMDGLSSLRERIRRLLDDRPSRARPQETARAAR